ncbi:MAG TPA: autotransporter domain-containing protein [Vineibacter sp.]|nr:autotransporter domain-containing protein [Vineibacter sp.]
MTLLAGAALAATASVGQAQFRTPNTTNVAGPQNATLGGTTITNHGLQGAGRFTADSRDQFGDTLGSFSAMALDLTQWRRNGSSYSGFLWGLPDRGYNTDTFLSNFASRLHGFSLLFTPYTGTANLPAETASQNQLQLTYRGSRLVTDFNGNPTTGLDPGTSTGAQGGVGNLPIATTGPAAGRLSIDAEGLAFRADGSFYISDEYGANVYYFSRDGRLQGVIKPPRDIQPEGPVGTPNFNSINPPAVGRRNNQGMEALSLTPDGRRLVVMLQSATVQSTGSSNQQDRRNTEVMVYDVTGGATPSAPIGHFAVTLPTFTLNGRGGAVNRTAAQSDLLALNDTQFLVLARDGNGLGPGTDNPVMFKSVLLVDISGATNLVGTRFANTSSSPIAVNGNLVPGITPAATVEVVNMLHVGQLTRFGFNTNTASPNRLTLSEKWEALALAPTLEEGKPHDYFLFVGNDNDFLTRVGSMQGIAYDAGLTNDNVILVYRLTMPGYVDPQFLRAMQTSGPITQARLRSTTFGLGAASTAAINNQVAIARRSEAGQPDRQTASRGDIESDIAWGAGLRPPQRFNLWFGGGFDRIKRDADSGIPANRSSQLSGVIGADYEVIDGLRLGGALGFGTGHTRYRDGGRQEHDATSLSVYGAYLGSNGFFAAASYTYTWLDYDRITRAGAFGTFPSGRTKGYMHTIDGETGFRWELGDGYWVMPSVGINIRTGTLDPYTESGGAGGNVSFPKQKVTGVQGRIEAEVGRRFDFSGIEVLPTARLGFEKELRRDRASANLSLVSTPGGIGTQSVTIPFALEDYVRFGIGLQAQMSANVVVSAAYDFRLGLKGGNVHSLVGGVSVGF